ncbi:MAG: phosphoribosylglycinamide formyltransferase [Bacteroidia bacterium]|nr:phosphoribosylglycinamide formyltransferase [Bacteroidia bacterium]MCZ2276829.1 phosphoribosylglycinamide formyltransferase [Bacteroidia bacterium]
MIQLAVFASSEGTNAENIIRYFTGHPSIQVGLVVSDRANAPVLQRASKLAVKTIVLKPGQPADASYLLNLLTEYKIDGIILAGYLRKIPQAVTSRFENRILNIHPALLPDFGGKGMYGMRVHEAVINAKKQESGITIHYVNENYDEGQIIFQTKVKVVDQDTPQSLSDKIRKLELLYYPKIIEKTLGAES